MSFKSVDFLGLPEVGSKPDKSAQISLDKSSSFPSLRRSSGSGTFGGLDLFTTPFAPQNATSSTVNNSEWPQSSLAQSVNLIQQSPVSSFSTFTDQQPSQLPQSSPLDLFPAPSQHQSVASSSGKAFDAVMPNTGGWTTFDTPQNVVPMGTENSIPSFVPSSDGNTLEKFNPFLMDQSSSYQDSSGHGPSVLTHALGHESRQNVQATMDNTHSWNVFEDSAGGQPIQEVLKRNEQASVHIASSVDRSCGFGAYEALNDGNLKTLDKSVPPSSTLSSNFSMAGLQSFATNHKPTNPFDLPYDSEMESSKMSQFWDMSSLQVALPNAHTPTSYAGGINQSWFPQNSVPYVPGGVSFDPTIGSLGFIAGQATTAQIQNIHAQGPVASVGGNPFA